MVRLIPAHVSVKIAVAKLLNKFSVKPAKRVVARFDPFYANVESIRDFLYYTSATKYRLTNPNCVFKSEVCNDRSEPILKVTLVDKKEIVFKTANLSCLEILSAFNKHISVLDKREEEALLDQKPSKGKLKRK